MNDENKKFEDFLTVLVKYRKTIIINVLLITVSALIVSLILEKRYTSTASLLPPKMKENISSFSSTIENISNTLMGRLGNVSEETYNYLAILQSRTASEKIIDKFNLRTVYKFDKDAPIEDVIRELSNNVNFNIEEEGNFLISVTDKDPVRAAKMANYYIEILNEISTSLGVREARSNRLFIEKRFIQLQDDISRVEDSLKSFGEQYHVIQFEEQVKAAINAAAELKAKTELAKIERDLLINNFGTDNPLVKQSELKLHELENQLAELRFGEDNKLKSTLKIFIPFEKVASTGIKYIRLMRDFEIQNKVLEFLYPLYEQAKIEEQKNIPAVLVLDPAVPPEKKSSPKRTIIVLSAFLLSLFFSILYAIIRESFSGIKKDEIRYQRIKSNIIDPLKNSFSMRRK